MAQTAGSQIKKTVLELGGSDPFIVMPSVDVDAIAIAAVKARTINNGQSCIAAKRFIVADSIYNDFERKFVKGMQALRVGDPMDEKTDVGPLATAKIRSELHEQVQRAVRAGAKLLTGGKPIDVATVLPDGTKFAGPSGLQDIMMARKDQFVDAFTERLMIYALGRGVDAANQPSIRAIRASAAKDNYRINDIILGIVQSVPFTMRRTPSHADPA